MTHTRMLLDDPAYHVWFLKFKNGSDGRGPEHHDRDGTYHAPVCDTSFHPPKCSALYHSQAQTPEYGNDFDMYFFYCILFIRDGPLTCNAPTLECALYVGSPGG